MRVAVPRPARLIPAVSSDGRPALLGLDRKKKEEDRAVPGLQLTEQQASEESVISRCTFLGRSRRCTFMAQLSKQSD